VDGLAGPIDATARLVAQKLQLRRPDARDDPELEELVSIAVACARRAEDAVQQAREISWMARRRMSVVVAVTGAAVLAASAVGVLDRYRLTGEVLPSSASAFIAAGPIGEAGSLGTAAVADPVSAPAAGQVLAPARLADRPPVPDAARTVTQVLPPVTPTRPAPIKVAAAPPPPTAAAMPPPVSPLPPAPAPTAAPVSQPVSPPAPAPVAVAAASPPQVSPAQVPIAAAVPPPAKVAEPATPPPAAEARASAPSPSLAPPSVGQIGNSSTGVPAEPAMVATAPVSEPAQLGQSAVVSASLDTPLQGAPQTSHPVRHARRATRRVFYYPPGPGVLLAQVVYGVRRNLYEIFH